MACVIVVAGRETGPPDALDGDRRAFQLKERVTSSDARDPHVAAQLIERMAGRSPTPRTLTCHKRPAPNSRTNGGAAEKRSRRPD